MTIEQRTITIEAYRDPFGKPTCSVSTQAGYTCRFLLDAGFGPPAVCGFGQQTILRRGGDDGLGYIEPHDKCPLWSQA